MGCDIHLFVEKKGTEGWSCVDSLTREEGSLTYANYNDLYYTGRNYNLFSMLADVRNGRGFAGVKTGEGFVPIAEPRDLPDDVSAEVAEMSEEWGGDGHSHSYHTLRQLLDYDWTQTTKLQGWCGFEEWSKWARWGREQGRGPQSYSGGVSGGGVKHITAKEMDALVAQCVALGSKEERDDFVKAHADVYALAEWTTPYSEEASNFLAGTLSRLLKLAGGSAGIDDVRIVFWFDN